MVNLSFLVLAFSAFLVSLTAYGNVVGTDLQNFNTTTGGIDFMTVEPSETLDVGIFNFGLVINYAVNSLPVFEDANETQNRLKPNDSIVTREYNFGVGLFKDFELGASLPEILRQKVDDQDVAHGSFNSIGYTSTRATAKYRLWSNSQDGVAIATSINFNRIRNNPYLGESNSPIYNVLLIADSTIAGWSVATNIGYRWRKSADPRAGSPILPTKNQVIASAAASYLLTSLDTKFIAEIYGSRPTEKTGSKFLERQSSSAELDLALKYDFTSQLSGYTGGGTELINGASSPDWRAFAGINWAVGPAFGQREETEAVVVTPKAPVQEETITLHSIQFKFGSDNQVLPGSMDMIRKVAEHIKEPPEFKKIIVKGHTDSVGRAEYNQVLSERRANAVRETLVKTYGFDPARIEAVGLGETMPIADNGNFQGRQKNRRVEIVIYR